MNRSVRARRLASWWWDYLVVLAWLAFVFLVVGVPQLAGWLDLSAIWTQPATADVTITVLTVIPYLTYLVVTEAAGDHATFGKRRAGFQVAGPAGPAAWGRTLVRNALKVLPWQLGHMSAMRFATEPEVSNAAILMFTASMLLLAAVAIPPLLGRRGIHDQLAGTAVRSSGVRASAPARATGQGFSRR